MQARRVHITRCRGVSQRGGFLLEGTSTWTDCSITDCACGFVANAVSGGTHTFVRVAIERCHALGGITSGKGSGLVMQAGSLTLRDSRIADCYAESSAGCLSVEDGALILRNTTLANCSAPEAPYIFIGISVATGFESEMLTLELLHCDAEHSGPLIAVSSGFNAPLNARGLKVVPPAECASTSLPVLSEHVRLLNCSDGDVCGDAAACKDVQPLAAVPSLKTVDCSCTGESFPNPNATSLALAPYGFDPSIDYCVRSPSNTLQ